MQDVSNTPIIGQGLHRDGDFLVVNIRTAQFPNRCVLTNEVTDGPLYRLRVFIPGGIPAGVGASHTAAKAAQVAGSAGTGAAIGGAGAVIGIVAMIGTAKKFYFPVGMKTELQRKFRFRHRVSVSMILGGLFGFMLYPIICLTIVTSVYGLLAKMSPALETSIAVVSIGGFASLVLGMIFFLATVRQPIRFRRLENGHIWFSGVSPGYLAELPKYDQ